MKRHLVDVMLEVLDELGATEIHPQHRSDFNLNPATGKPIEEMTLMKHFEKELHQAQGSVDLLCAKSIKNKIKEGDNFAIGLWARNKFGWDRPGQTMTFRVPDQNGDIGDDNKIIIELVKAPRRED